MDQQKVVNEALLAIGEWAALGYPIPTQNLGFTSDAKQTGETIKKWAQDPQTFNAKIILDYTRQYIAVYRMDLADKQRADEMNRERLARLEAKNAIASEVASIRKAFGLTQAEMDTLLNLKTGTVQQVENAGSYGLDRFTEILAKARVEAKLRGINIPSEEQK